MSGEMFADWPTWLVMRDNFEAESWTVVGEVQAPDAGSAFRKLVSPPGTIIDPSNIGKGFRIFNLKGSANLAIELNLVDLDARRSARD